MDWTTQYKKAITFSYDDGIEQDIRLLEILNRFGLKATFNLNTGLNFDHGTWRYDDLFDVHRLNLEEDFKLYDGHEIAVHGSKHYCLTELTSDELHRELAKDAEEIERLFGEKPVGMAYAYGVYNEQVIEKIRELGIKYGRTVVPSYSFDEQSELLTFLPSCHLDDAR